MPVYRTLHAGTLSEPDQASPCERSTEPWLSECCARRVFKCCLSTWDEWLLSSWLRCVLKWNMFVVGLGIRRNGCPMVTALRPTRIKSLLFAAVDAIQSKAFPTLHHQCLNLESPSFVRIIINPCCIERLV